MTEPEVGSGVTLKCTILRRPCPITKKQYSRLKGSVGTVKKPHGGYGLTMIGKECEPAFGRIAPPPYPSKIPGDGAFGDLQAELQQFAVDLWPTPVRVF
jgi:hypothetical protein